MQRRRNNWKGIEICLQHPKVAAISDYLVSLYNLLEDKSICLDLKAVIFDAREPETFQQRYIFLWFRSAENWTCMYWVELSQTGLLVTDIISSKRPLQQSTLQLSLRMLILLFPLIRQVQADKIYFCPYNKPVIQFSISVCRSSPIAKRSTMLISIFIMLCLILVNLLHA